MGDNFAPFDIILLAVIAAFLVLRLRSVLGRRTGTEKRPLDPFHAPETTVKRGGEGPAKPADKEKVAAPKPAHAAETPEPETPLARGLRDIAALDPYFSPESFLEGARAAFSWVVEAFAKGDAKILRPLLNDDVYGNFVTAIENRSKAGETLETALVGIKSAEILEARREGKIAFVTVKFISEQVNITRNRAGEVIDGDPVRVVPVTDIWTFARDTRSRDPNWVLVATRSSN